MSTPQQVVVWTALPTGVTELQGGGQSLQLSVFVAPQLNPASGHDELLTSFHDFANWPATVGSAASEPVSFTVTLSRNGHEVVVPASIVTPAPPSGATPKHSWAAVFDPARTVVTPFGDFPDYSSYEVLSFPAGEVTTFVQDLYTQMAQVALTEPITLASAKGVFFGSSTVAPGTKVSPELVYTNLRELVPRDRSDRPRVTPQQAALEDLWAFHKPLGDQNPGYSVQTPTIDFNTALAAFGNYPAVLRLLCLVFDLTITAPATLTPGDLNLLVKPRWHSQMPTGESVDFTPWTAATLTNSTFLATPSATSPDYANGMLDLSSSRFSVTDLDMDLAGDRLFSLSLALQTRSQSELRNYEIQAEGYSAELQSAMAVTVPALKSIGPQVLWNNYSTAPFAGLAGRISGQSALLAELKTWLASRSVADLPTIYAEQLVRGHRFDVFTASETHPAWWSLCGRAGAYRLGAYSGSPILFDVVDEGVVTPGVSSPAGTTSPPPAQLRVHESIMRWHGWGLCAQRVGGKIAEDDSGTLPDDDNPSVKPGPSGSANPQFSAFCRPAGAIAAEYRFPVLRFGNRYQFRARAVDLAGNSLPPSSTDASTATSEYTHYRYEPLRPPALCGIKPFTTGEGTHFLVLLDDQVDPVTTNGRWLFPPQVAQLTAEEHGMFDGFVPGQPPNHNDGPAGDATTYQTILSYDGQNLGDIRTDFSDPTAPLIGTYDVNNKNVPYFTGDPVPYTPWLSDPISDGPALTGLPGVATNVAFSVKWRGVWPAVEPIVLLLHSGSDPPTYTAATDTTPAVITIQLGQADTANVRISSGLNGAGLRTLGVWPWILSTGEASALADIAYNGQAWMLTPFQVVRMLHAVRLPLTAPSFGSPYATRNPGATSANINDPEFIVDEKSTSHVDITAVWIDPVDDPSLPGPTAVKSNGHGFRLSIPDPNPIGPESQPLVPFSVPKPFSFQPSADQYQESSTQYFGDTIHHTVEYTATGNSRFAELFSSEVEAVLTVGAAITIGTAALGLNAASVSIRAKALLVGTNFGYYEQLEPHVDFAADAANRTVILLPTQFRRHGEQFRCIITYQPTTTVTGPTVPVEVLASTRPSAPVVSEVVPAWQLFAPEGTLAEGEIEVTRKGGFLRVYLERPWYSSGAGEMLGVVTTAVSESSYTSTFPTVRQQAWVTMMGLDPINYMGAAAMPWPVVPTSFTNLADIPSVPYRPPFSSPPQVYLVEDDSQLYDVWPYEVHFDEVTRRWYADVSPNPGVTPAGTFPPPPGYFIRLALCRFQPYSEAYGQGKSIEVSPVVLATFAQPVPDRTVSIVPDTADSSGESIYVTVTGPAYQGWRPPNTSLETSNVSKGWYWQYDGNNGYAPQNAAIYGDEEANTHGIEWTSAMVVEVQIQSSVLLKQGFEGDLAWEVVSGQTPVLLPPTFSPQTSVTWGAGDSGLVKLPQPVTSAVKMRLRISEIDYYGATTPPTKVDTSYRRPFVSLIPIN
jgi:hypothetical protein